MDHIVFDSPFLFEISDWCHAAISHILLCKDGCLSHWGRVTYTCVGKLTIIGSDNGLSPERRQAIIWTNAGILLIGPLGTNFSYILIEIQIFSLKKIHLKMSYGKCCWFRLGLNVSIVLHLQFTPPVCLSVRLFRVPCPFCGSLPIWWFIYGMNTTHEGRVLFYFQVNRS